MNTEGKATILIVDDSDIIRYSLKSFFSDYNFEVITCLNGLEGIQKSVENKPDLIFLDLMMPNFDGMKMLQVLKVMDNLKLIPVIVISGNTNKTNVLSAIEAGADRVISKPLQKEIIIKNIIDLLGPDFLKKSKKNNAEVNDKNKELLNHLSKFFLDKFPEKKIKLVDALRKRNKGTMAILIHEIKGAGGTIGYPIISVICYEIEKILDLNVIDWSLIDTKCRQIFSIVEKIEFLKTTVSN